MASGSSLEAIDLVELIEDDPEAYAETSFIAPEASATDSAEVLAENPYRYVTRMKIRIRDSTADHPDPPQEVTPKKGPKSYCCV